MSSDCNQFVTSFDEFKYNMHTKTLDGNSFLNSSNLSLLPTELAIFSPLLLSQRKSIRSPTGPPYLDDSFDEMLSTNPSLLENSINDVEHDSKLDSFDEELSGYELFKKESDKRFLSENVFLNSPLFKTCIRPKGLLQNIIYLRPVSPCIMKLQTESSGKLSLSELSIRKLLKLRKVIMDTKRFKEKDMLNNYLDNAFKELLYINQRSIVLRAIDKRNSVLNSDLNEKYMSAYNAFRLFVTFSNIKKMKYYKDLIYNVSVNHLFDKQLYWIRYSTCNFRRIHEISRSTQLLKNEILMLSSFNHPNIIRYYSSWFEYQCFYEQLEYAPGGCLDDYIRNNLKRPNRVFNILSSNGGTRKISYAAALEIIRQISSAVAHIESINLIHGNISTEHIMIFPDKSVMMDKDWIMAGLQGPTVPLVFKLCGFERCVKCCYGQNSQDVRDIAAVVIRSILGVPSSASDDLWCRVFPVASWCKDRKLCSLLEEMSYGSVVSAASIEKSFIGE